MTHSSGIRGYFKGNEKLKEEEGNVDFRKYINTTTSYSLSEYSRPSNSGHFYRQGQVAVIGRWLLFWGLLQRFTMFGTEG